MGFLDRLLKQAAETIAGAAINGATKSSSQNSNGASNQGYSGNVASGNSGSRNSYGAKGEKGIDLRKDMWALLTGEFPEYDVRQDISASTFGAPYGSKDYDFGLYKNGEPVMVIMITDHNRDNNREYRGLKAACENSNVKFLNFFTHMPNKRSYVVDRIRTNL